MKRFIRDEDTEWISIARIKPEKPKIDYEKLERERLLEIDRIERFYENSCRLEKPYKNRYSVTCDWPPYKAIENIETAILGLQILEKSINKKYFHNRRRKYIESFECCPFVNSKGLDGPHSKQPNNILGWIVQILNMPHLYIWGGSVYNFIEKEMELSLEQITELNNQRNTSCAIEYLKEILDSKWLSEIDYCPATG